MLTTMGQGVVLNALLQQGFTASYNHFDICRLFKRTDSGEIINAEVTMEVDFGNYRGEAFTSKQEVEPENFPRVLSHLAAVLENSGCSMVTTPGASAGNCVFASVASFERIDSIGLGTLSGGPAPSHFQKFSTKVKVRLSLQKA